MQQLVLSPNINLDTLSMDSREEHLIWVKQRALELIELGHFQMALDSIYSDLKKHPETKNHPAIYQGFMLNVQGLLATKKQIRVFLSGISNMNTSLSEKIKRALANGEKTAGVLKDEVGASYPELFAEISRLAEVGEVEHRLTDDTCPALSYRLVKKIILPIFGRVS